MKKKVSFTIFVVCLLLIVVGALLYLEPWNGKSTVNVVSAKRFDVKGVDVSHYQGEIDWKKLSSQNISFAFIKATEGTTFVDNKFAYNFSEAQKTSLAVGAYHFYSYESSGKGQAEHYIRNVPPFKGMLPPVIDLEFYCTHYESPPAREDVETDLKAMLLALEEYYGQKPIIYATSRSYNLYLSGDYSDYDIWIRNVNKKPVLNDGRRWTFWQYSAKGTLEGYVGDEKFIDLNVFNGSEDEFIKYLENRTFR